MEEYFSDSPPSSISKSLPSILLFKQEASLNDLDAIISRAEVDAFVYLKRYIYLLILFLTDRKSKHVDKIKINVARIETGRGIAFENAEIAESWTDPFGDRFRYVVIQWIRDSGRTRGDS